MTNLKKLCIFLAVIGAVSFPLSKAIAADSQSTTEASASVSDVQNPAKFLADFVGNIKHEVQKNQLSLSNSPDQLYALVEQQVLPHIALDEMAGSALGAKWRAASPAIQKEFIVEFAKMVTHNYSAGLLKVSDYSFKIYPIRDAVWKKESKVSINGVIQPNGGGAGSNVTYYLERSGQTWKIYDLAVEGISFVSNYRSQFESYSSVEVLVPALKTLNERLQ
jgi:phospholipid transport system substrate-binding protein